MQQALGKAQLAAAAGQAGQAAAAKLKNVAAQAAAGQAGQAAAKLKNMAVQAAAEQAGQAAAKVKDMAAQAGQAAAEKMRIAGDQAVGIAKQAADSAQAAVKVASKAGVTAALEKAANAPGWRFVPKWLPRPDIPAFDIKWAWGKNGKATSKWLPSILTQLSAIHVILYGLTAALFFRCGWGLALFCADLKGKEGCCAKQHPNQHAMQPAKQHVKPAVQAEADPAAAAPADELVDSIPASNCPGTPPPPDEVALKHGNATPTANSTSSSASNSGSPAALTRSQDNTQTSSQHQAKASTISGSDGQQSTHSTSAPVASSSLEQQRNELFGLGTKQQHSAKTATAHASSSADSKPMLQLLKQQMTPAQLVQHLEEENARLRHKMLKQRTEYDRHMQDMRESQHRVEERLEEALMRLAGIDSKLDRLFKSVKDWLRRMSKDENTTSTTASAAWGYWVMAATALLCSLKYGGMRGVASTCGKRWPRQHLPSSKLRFLRRVWGSWKFICCIVPPFLKYVGGFVGLLLVLRFVLPRPDKQAVKASARFTMVQLCIQQMVLMAMGGSVLMSMLGASWPIFVLLWEVWCGLQFALLHATQLEETVRSVLEPLLLGAVMPVLTASMPFMLPRFVRWAVVRLGLAWLRL